MKKLSILSSLIVVFALLITSCKKNGTGGKAMIHAEIFHHEAPIYGSTVYIKFNAKDAPSNPETNYDLKVVGEDTENHVHIEGMRPGDYYLYAVGFDPAINSTVKGGIPVSIKWKERKQTTDVEIPVTE